MTYSIKEAFDHIEKKMIDNITNSLYQIYFHQNATIEELENYYGWESPFKEYERGALVEDTLRRLKQEQFILNFYYKNKRDIIKTYGNKKPTGDFNITIQFTDGDSDIKGSSDQGVVKVESRENNGSETRPEQDGIQTDNSERKTIKSKRSIGDRSNVVRGNRSNDKRGKRK